MYYLPHRYKADVITMLAMTRGERNKIMNEINQKVHPDLHQVRITKEISNLNTILKKRFVIVISHNDNTYNNDTTNAIKIKDAISNIIILSEEFIVSKVDEVVLWIAKKNWKQENEK